MHGTVRREKKDMAYGARFVCFMVLGASPKITKLPTMNVYLVNASCYLPFGGLIWLLGFSKDLCRI
jgi:hypothetical protein